MSNFSQFSPGNTPLIQTDDYHHHLPQKIARSKLHKSARNCTIFLMYFFPIPPGNGAGWGRFARCTKNEAIAVRRRRGKGARIEGWKAGCFIWGRIARDTPAVKPVLKNHTETESEKQAARMRLVEFYGVGIKCGNITPQAWREKEKNHSKT